MVVFVCVSVGGVGVLPRALTLEEDKVIHRGAVYRHHRGVLHMKRVWWLGKRGLDRLDRDWAECSQQLLQRQLVSWRPSHHAGPEHRGP